MLRTLVLAAAVALVTCSVRADVKLYADPGVVYPVGNVAEGPSGIDMTVVLNNGKGEPLRDYDQRKGKDDACENCPPLTLGHAIYYSLLATWRDEPADWKEMWTRAKLAERVRDNKAAALSAEEVSKILPLLGKAFGTLVIAQAVPLLDPNAK